jgi:membrane-associated protease RseP (regulator of RpoE activity)
MSLNSANMTPPLREIVARYMTVKRSFADANTLSIEDASLISRVQGRYSASFMGMLHGDSAQAYDELDAELRPHNLFALFREHENSHIVHVVQGRINATRTTNVWLPIVLFVLTVLSVMFTGTLIAMGEIGLSDPAQAQAIEDNIFGNLWRGLPYAIGVLLILGGHEMGHYLQMRRYGVASSLPYFIPSFGISPFGTFGATIVLREPLKNRKILFDMGMTGPLVGVVIAIPILLIGLSTSSVMPMSGGLIEGNSVVYFLSKVLVFGRALPDGQVDVLVNQLAWAGWTGLFVTALNLTPLGQLDGGHVLYALAGDYARRFYYPLLAIMFFLTLFYSAAWMLLVVLILVMGRYYAVPLDDITPLDNRRQWMGVGMLVLFGVLFVPVPLSQYGVNDGLIAGFLAVSTWTLFRRWGR